ncbi:MAG: hypothetical protein IT204_11800 [Fimbriimonadaceae bacterium]|nr:hypothetical protein [Fimbriimonadaceae bacterium]
MAGITSEAFRRSVLADTAVGALLRQTAAAVTLPEEPIRARFVTLPPGEVGEQLAAYALWRLLGLESDNRREEAATTWLERRLALTRLLLADGLAAGEVDLLLSALLPRLAANQVLFDRIVDRFLGL